MSKVKMGFFKVFIPKEYHIHVVKQDSEYLLDYAEYVEKPLDVSEEEFEKAVAFTLKVASSARKAGLEESLERTDRGCVFRMKGRLSLERVGDVLSAEFLSISKLGGITIRDLLILAFLGAILAEAKASEPEVILGRSGETKGAGKT
ncbi:MAG: hypothetical protein QXT14_03055 [Candidatus Bathyarchaeia archaeon]